MNRLSTEKRATIVRALCEGCSIRSTVRMTGASKNTIGKLLVELGGACADYHDAHVRNVLPARVQMDEIWTFCYAKAKNVPDEKKGQFGYGDVWTWTGMDADSKLMISYMVGPRSSVMAYEFVQDIRQRAIGRLEITSDGQKWYLNAVEAAFGDDVDYAMLQKRFGTTTEGWKSGRYSPPQLTGCWKEEITGNPDPKHISTSFVERQNLSMRMSMRRYTRLTNGFSKKIENHIAMVAIYFMYYNYARVHQSIRVTPAMEAGLADHVWSIEEIVALLPN
jgi:IS1 family transposase